MKKNITRKDIVKVVLLILPVVAIVVSICASIIVVSSRTVIVEKLDSIDTELAILNNDDDDSMTLSESIRKRNPLFEMRVKPVHKDNIRVQGPMRTYEFTDMELICNDFVMDNDLYYEYKVQPYISPGVGRDVLIRGDEDDRHWIKVHVVNTMDADLCACDCSVYSIGVEGLEGFSINGISIGDNMEDVLIRTGIPDAFSVSDYDVISGAMYDYGDFRINIQASILSGDVEYIEVVCEDTDGYDNGRWK